MATLSASLVNKFAAAINDSLRTSGSPTTAYGYVVTGTDSSGEKFYVQLDGSTTNTAVTSGTDVREGDRVLVTIENHVATVTSNLSNPASSYVATETAAEATENTSDLAIRVAALEASMITSDYLKTYYASIESLTNSSADLDINTLTSKEITAETLSALNIDVTKLTANTANVSYLTADMANIASESVSLSTITTLFAKLGLITEEVVDKSNICTLNAVEINADCITAGTLSVEHLCIVGENSIVYEINANSSGLTTTELSNTDYQKYLNGTTIVANSITASQIAASTITGNEIAANTITASHLNVTSLSAICANIGNLTINGYMTTNSKRTTYNSTVAGMTIDANGIGGYGDSNNYWYFGSDGSFHLEIEGDDSTVFVLNGVSYYPKLTIHNGYITLCASGYTAETSPIGYVQIDPSGISFFYKDNGAWCSISNLNKCIEINGNIYE